MGMRKLAKVFDKHLAARRECILTAFSITPSQTLLQEVRQIFLNIVVLFIRVSQISKIFGPTVFCVLLNERKLVRPSLGILRVIFHVGQASKAYWSGG